jgi:hypothetical protein
MVEHNSGEWRGSSWRGMNVLTEVEDGNMASLDCGTVEHGHGLMLSVREIRDKCVKEDIEGIKKLLCAGPLDASRTSKLGDASANENFIRQILYDLLNI